MKVVVFDVWGDYGHFRRFFTTTSPLTFPFPPPTALRGLVGAILGIDKDDYLKVLSHEVCRVGIGLLSEVKKTRMGLNLLDTKDGHWIKKGPRKTPRTQIKYEFLKEPKYRIYFSHSDEALLDKLRQSLVRHESFYTPYLGISECLADFAFVDLREAKPIQGKAQINSAFRLSDVSGGFELHEGLAIMKVRMPLKMAPGRKVVEVDEVVYESSGRPISVSLNEAYSLGELGNISFL